MRLFSLFCVLFVALLVGACSDRQVYDALQKRNEMDCYLLEVSKQQDCLEKARELGYNAYQRELDKFRGQQQ